MKRNFFLLAVAILTALAANAELSQSIVATLTHDATVTTYTGGNALKEAHTAAVDGDAIVLSPGTFNAVNITKAITLRGAGAAAISLPEMTIEPIGSTYITGQMDINIESTNGSLNIEGCQFEGSVAFKKAPVTNVFKCRFSNITNILRQVAEINFTHCSLVFANQTSDLCQKLNMLNCYAKINYFNPYTKATNCVLESNNSSAWSYLSGLPADGLLRNCIIYYTNSSYTVYAHSANMVAYNCVAIGSSTSRLSGFFNNSSNGTNKIAVISDVLSITSWPYTLTETAATTYLGNDGTQVGIHGGILPFDPIPDNLLVTSCNIASKTTADGKLSVEIKVSTAK